LSLVSAISRCRLKVASTSRRAMAGLFSSRGTSMPMSTRWGKAAYSLATSMSQTSLLTASCSGIAVSRSDWPPARMLGLLRASTSGTSRSALNPPGSSTRRAYWMFWPGRTFSTERNLCTASGR
jgi:hypothetical protein